MTEKARAILDAATARVFAYRPPEAQAKRRQREKRKAQDVRESSI